MLTRRSFQILPLLGALAAGCAQGATPTDEASSALSEKNGWANGWANGWNNGWANGWANGWNNGWANGWINGWANGWANGFNNGWANGFNNGWANGWANGADPTSVAVQADSSKYLTRGRIEDGRHMVDSCIVPSALGLAQCPIDVNASGECCRRAMALQGVYWADLKQTGFGRQLDYQPTATVTDPNGVSGTIDTTLVLDPCYTVNGVKTCDTTPNHFWDLAGPGAPLYPDCNDNVSGLPCNHISLTGTHQLVDTGITSSTVEVRQELISSMSALLTTNGHYRVDLRWIGNKDTSALLVPDPLFNASAVEAKWSVGTKSVTVNGMSVKRQFGSPSCYASNSPARATCDPTTNPDCVAGLVSLVPVCSKSYVGQIETLWSGQTY
jgi:hypothetical protein